MRSIVFSLVALSCSSAVGPNAADPRTAMAGREKGSSELDGSIDDPGAESEVVASVEERPKAVRKVVWDMRGMRKPGRQIDGSWSTGRDMNEDFYALVFPGDGCAGHCIDGQWVPWFFGHAHGRFHEKRGERAFLVGERDCAMYTSERKLELVVKGSDGKQELARHAWLEGAQLVGVENAFGDLRDELWVEWPAGSKMLENGKVGLLSVTENGVEELYRSAFGNRDNCTERGGSLERMVLVVNGDALFEELWRAPCRSDGMSNKKEEFEFFESREVPLRGLATSFQSFSDAAQD